MSPAQTPAPRGARWRARVAARLRSESGDALIEILITAVVVALIAGATLTGYAQVEHLGGLDRHRNEATALAQQDEARLRGLTITELSATGTGTGNTTSSVVVDGTTYTITSTAKFVSGSSSAASCTTGPVTTTADEVETTSSVSWNGDAGTPIAIHGLVTPDEGGSLIVTAVGPSGTTGLAGVTATLSGGPTTVSPLTTDSNGCAVFGGLDGGSYNVAFSDPGYVDVNGNSPPTSQTVTVVPTETAKTNELELGQAGTIQATFQTTYTNGSSTTTEAATDDQFTAVNSGITSPSGYRTFGTDSTSSNNSFTSAINTGATMFPFTGAYTAYAGACISTPPSAGVVSTTVTGGTTNNIVLPEPAMIVLPYTNQSTDDDANSAWSYTTSSGKTWTANTGNSNEYAGTDHSTANANAEATLTFSGTGVTVYGTTGVAEGEATFQVDSGSTTTENFYSSSTQYQQQIYTVSGLSNGTHHLYVTATGTYSNSPPRNGQNPYGATVVLDFASVTGATALTTTKPGITVTDTGSGCGNNEDYPPVANPPYNTTLGALANPGLPYGTYTVCVDNGVNHVTLTNVANTSYTSSNIVTADIYPNPPTGTYGTGTCT